MMKTGIESRAQDAKGQPLVIFGNGQMAELAYARFCNDERYRVVAFTVDRSVLDAPQLRGLPVIAFDELPAAFAPADTGIFVAVGPVKINRIRAERLAQAKQLGYSPVSWISPHAVINDFVEVGVGCSIGDNVVIAPYTTIGDGVHIAAGSVIGHHCTLGNACFIGVNCTVNGSVQVGEYAMLGAGAVIRDNVSIGASCVIGIGTVIVRDTPAESVYAAPEAVHLPIKSSRIRV